MIKFNVPLFIGNELEYIKKCINNEKICGDGEFTKKCSDWVEKNFNVNKCLMTTSCTHALEMAALLMDVKDGDEIIMPSYTFVSTANAFALRGAKIVFVDIRPDTMNINEDLIESAISEKTKAIVAVHYAGVSCEMDKIMEIARAYNLLVVEDAAQGVMSTYKGRALGSIGDFGCFSFHETKNYTMGEGGAITIQNSDYIEKAEIIREKGTDRSKFIRGQVDKYTWQSIGSSYLPSELNAAYLYAQLEKAEKVNQNRLQSWECYMQELKILEREGIISLPYIPDSCEHNAHMFYIKVKDRIERANIIEYLKQNGIMATFHYIPLHTAPAGSMLGIFSGKDIFTTEESSKLLRLPIYYGMKKDDIEFVVKKVIDFYK